jgi:hypothetical protein
MEEMIKRLMRPSQARYADARRFVTIVTTLLGVPAYWFCWSRHLCMGGHMEHPPYPVWHYVNDAAWLLALPVAAVSSVRSALPFRVLVTVVLCLLVLRYVSPWPFFLAPLAILLVLWGLVWPPIAKRRGKGSPNQASHATSEPAPGAASSAPQG